MNGAKKLPGQVALVTGAGKRLGRAVALRLAAEGADVAVHYGKSAAEAREVVGEIEKMGRRAAAFSAELTNVPEIQKLVAGCAAHFGQLRWTQTSRLHFFARRRLRRTSQKAAAARSLISRTSEDYLAGASFCRIRFRKRV